MFLSRKFLRNTAKVWIIKNIVIANSYFPKLSLLSYLLLYLLNSMTTFPPLSLIALLLYLLSCLPPYFLTSLPTFIPFSLLPGFHPYFPTSEALFLLSYLSPYFHTSLPTFIYLSLYFPTSLPTSLSPSLQYFPTSLSLLPCISPYFPTFVISVDDTELRPLKLLEEIEVRLTELSRLRMNVQREYLPLRFRSGFESGFDVWNLKRATQRVDVARQSAAVRTENGCHTKAGLVTDWKKYRK